MRPKHLKLNHYIIRIVLILQIIAFSIHAKGTNPAHFYLGQKDLINTNIYSLKHHSDGFLYAATNFGLYKYHQGKFRLVPWGDEHLGTSLFSLQTGFENHLYAVNLSGQVFRLEAGKLKLFVQVPKEFISSDGIEITFDSENNLILRSSVCAIFKVEIQEWKVLLDKNNNVQKFNVYDPKNILVASNFSGLISSVHNGKVSSLRFTEESTRNFKEEQYLHRYPFVYKKNPFSVNRIGLIYDYKLQRSTYYDSLQGAIFKQLDEKEIWVYGQSFGIHKLMLKENGIECSKKLFKKTFISAIEKKDGTIFLGTFGKGVIVIPDMNSTMYLPKINHFEHIQILNEQKFTRSVETKLVDYDFILEDKSKIKVLYGRDYIYYQDGVDFQLNNDFPSLLYQIKTKPSSRVGNFGTLKQAIPINEGATLIASSTGVFKVGNGLEHISWLRNGGAENWSSLKKELFRCKTVGYHSKSKTLLYASQQGLFLLDSNQNEKEVLFNEKCIICVNILSTEQGFICATHEDGILFIEEGKVVRQLSKKQGLKDNYVQRLLVHHDKLFISTRRGFQVLNLRTYNWEFLGKYSRIINGVVMDMKIADKTLWLASGDKLITIPMEKIEQAPKYDFKIGKLILGTEVRSRNDYANIETSYDQGHLNVFFDFKGILYEEDAKIEYRLNSTNWKSIPATTANIEREALSPGSYKMDVRINYFGQFSNEQSIFFLIKPPFWQTWWFITLIVLITAFSVGFLYRRQNIKQQIQQKLITDRLDSELKALRSQMNPHFIFNSLNSIQDLVMRQDVKKTYDYIVQFSKLVRNTLNYSGMDFITIDQEIDFLEVYLSLEKLRFMEEFEYSISYEGNENVEVPSLLIQPFLENALVHGLMHKSGLKKLSVEFDLKEHLECRIIDNGVGRSRAKEILERQRGDHKSFAMEAIQQRLALLNEQLETKSAQYEIVDLVENDKPSGTMVIVQIPIKKEE